MKRSTKSKTTKTTAKKPTKTKTPKTTPSTKVGAYTDKHITIIASGHTPPVKRIVKPLIYVAGPYTASTKVNVAHNIVCAQRIADAINRSGLAWAVVPHSLGANIEDSLSPSDWYPMTARVLERCDALIGFHWSVNFSTGVLEEVALASAKGIPYKVFQVDVMGPTFLRRVEDVVKRLIAALPVDWADK